MPSSKLVVPQTYAELRRSVENVVLKGRQQIERAWVQTYHECGRLIHEHILQNKDRAGYGAQVIKRLAADSEISERILYQCGQFYRCFPILHVRAKLTWMHYRVLCEVGDEKQRASLLQAALTNDWNATQLEEQVRVANASLRADSPSTATVFTQTPAKLLTAKRGQPGVYRVVARGEALAADLGFKLYLALDETSTAFKAGGFATFDARGRPQPAPDATKADLFTYAVAVRRVIDGDTLEVELALPRGYAHVMKLRLRALDCPEMDTPEGKAAKRFTEALVLPATAVEIVTSKPDKYDRYLADVFLTQPDGRVAYLNQELLTAAHAIRKDEWSASDWEH